MTDVTLEQRIFLRSQRKLGNDDKTDIIDVFRGQSSAVKAQVLDPTPYSNL